MPFKPFMRGFVDSGRAVLVAAVLAVAVSGCTGTGHGVFETPAPSPSALTQSEAVWQGYCLAPADPPSGVLVVESVFYHYSPTGYQAPSISLTARVVNDTDVTAFDAWATFTFTDEDGRDVTSELPEEFQYKYSHSSITMRAHTRNLIVDTYPAPAGWDEDIKVSLTVSVTTWCIPVPDPSTS